jgi:hypothetical protein
MTGHYRFLLWRCLIAVGVLAACASPIRAQRGLAMTTLDAADKARAVVNARVLSVDVRSVAGNIYTFVDFQTISVAKGDVPARFTHRMLGGRLGNVEIDAGDEMPKFTPGEEVVIFLGPEFSSDGYPTLFPHQVYRVATQGGVKYVTPNPTGLVVGDTRGGPVNPSAPTRLEDFLNAVKSVK